MRKGEHVGVHAPRVGRLARLAGPLRVTGVFWYRLHSWGAARLPDWVATLLLPLFALAFSLVLRAVRKAVARNLLPVLGPCGFWERQRRIYRTILSFSWCMTERYQAHAGRHRFEVETVGMEHWQEAEDSGRGFILVTAHIGGWEIGSHLPASSRGRRIHIIREEEMDPRAQRLVHEMVSRIGGDRYVTHFAHDNPALGVTLLEALRHGEIVAVQGDRPRAQGKTIDVTLFEKPFALPCGPLVLARVAGARLLPVFIFRKGRRRYSVVFRPAITVSGEGPRQEATGPAAAAIATDIEWAIRESPHQWFCFADLWP